MKITRSKDLSGAPRKELSKRHGLGSGISHDHPTLVLCCFNRRKIVCCRLPLHIYRFQELSRTSAQNQRPLKTISYASLSARPATLQGEPNQLAVRPRSWKPAAAACPTSNTVIHSLAAMTSSRSVSSNEPLARRCKHTCRHWHRASSFIIFFFRPCLDNRIGIASERLSLAVSPGASERRQAWELLRQICAQFCSPNMQNSHPNETALCQSSPAQAADPLVTQRTDKNTTQHTHLHSFVVRIRITFSISNKKYGIDIEWPHLAGR